MTKFQIVSIVAMAVVILVLLVIYLPEKASLLLYKAVIVVCVAGVLGFFGLGALGLLW